MLKYLWGAACALCWVACGQDSGTPTPAILPERMPITTPEKWEITVIDTLQNALHPIRSHEMSQARYSPLYLGALRDTIILTYGEIDFKTQFYPLQTTEGLYRLPDKKGDLKVRVSTQHQVSRRAPMQPAGKRDTLARHLVCIENTSGDTLDIGYGYHIPLILQAQDNQGKWRAVEYPLIFDCGTGLMHFYLPPQEIILTTCPIFEGNYATHLRLVYGWDTTLYSNIFEGKIDTAQWIEKRY